MIIFILSCVIVPPIYMYQPLIIPKYVNIQNLLSLREKNIYLLIHILF
jgi:hypothetical protein